MEKLAEDDDIDLLREKKTLFTGCIQEGGQQRWLFLLVFRDTPLLGKSYVSTDVGEIW